MKREVIKEKIVKVPIEVITEVPVYVYIDKPIYKEKIVYREVPVNITNWVINEDETTVVNQ
jgi:hypothetical protein